ncbi:MAG: HEAT repeat domain-containing protein [Armatimonadetes bacterium]|nr:HEAT repeat domain-containing protein [Armatimonadota bacterium]
MRRASLWVLGGVLLAGLQASGHLCNNIYRTPDRIVVKPEKQVTTVDRTEQFRVFVQNNYPTWLNNIRLTARPDGGNITVQVTPQSIAELRAGQRTAFQVKVEVPEATARGTYHLKFGISANQLDFRPVEEPTLAALRESAKDGGNLSHMVLAAESLARLDDPRGAAVLTKMAASGDRDYRGRAIRALGKCGDSKQIAFLRGLTSAQDAWIRGNALLALGDLKDELTTFTPFAQDRDEFARVCGFAGWTMAGGKDAETTKWLKGLLTYDNVYVQIAAGWAMALQRDKDAVAALDRGFHTDEPMRRVFAGDALVDVAARTGL